MTHNSDQRSARDAMLSRIRASLAKQRPQLEALAAQAPHAPPPFVHPPAEELAEQFAQELERLQGNVYRCPNDAAALEHIRTLLTKHNATSVIAWEFEQIGLSGLKELLEDLQIVKLDSVALGPDRAERLQQLEPAQICISGADVGIAESGTLMVRGGPQRGRLASLLAPVHIAVLRTSQLVRGLGQALAEIQSRHGPDVFADSSSLTLITGPSRTADIEMTLTHGVHGPREVHVMLIG